MEELFELEKAYAAKLKLFNELKLEMEPINEKIRELRESYNKEVLSEAKSSNELKKIEMSLTEFQNKMISGIEDGKEFLDAIVDLTHGHYVYIPFDFRRWRYNLNDNYYFSSANNHTYLEGFYLYRLNNGYVFHPARYKNFDPKTVSKELILTHQKSELKNGNYVREDLDYLFTKSIETLQHTGDNSREILVLKEALKKMRLRKLVNGKSHGE